MMSLQEQFMDYGDHLYRTVAYPHATNYSNKDIYRPETEVIKAKRIIEEKELNPSEIQGSGKDGRITKADVISHVEKDPVTKESVKKTNVDLDRETKRDCPLIRKYFYLPT